MSDTKQAEIDRLKAENEILLGSNLISKIYTLEQLNAELKDAIIETRKALEDGDSEALGDLYVKLGRLVNGNEQ